MGTMINRRYFMTMLGGVVTALAADPVVAWVPAPLPISEPEYLNLNQINAIAFAIHAEAFPEHRAHYRTRALMCISEMRGSWRS